MALYTVAMNFLIVIYKIESNDYTAKFLDFINNKIDIISKKINADIKYIDEKYDSSVSFLESLQVLSENYESVLLISNAMPLIDVEETIKLCHLHTNSMAYYTYAENYPKGIVPIAFRTSALERFIGLATNKTDIKIDYELIHNLVFVDPNFFEVEILLSEYDMRYYRLDFFSTSKRNSILIDNFINYNSYSEIVSSVKENPNLRRTLPAYIELDVTNTQNCLTKYSINKISEKLECMDFENFKKIYNNLIDFTNDFHISIGSFYEPLLHDSIFDILKFATSYKNAKIYLETNALLLDENTAKKLISMQKEYSNLNVIIHIDSIEEASYNNIYKENNLNIILNNLDYYLLREPRNTYLQIIKQKNNFDNIKDFYKYFEKYKVNIIMQKYSTFRGNIVDYKIGDMKPLVNVGCWHLARDLYIDMFGNVPICKYDIKKEIILGNIFSKSIEEIWSSGNTYYFENVASNAEFCFNCDDWYLYNF